MVVLEVVDLKVVVLKMVVGCLRWRWCLRWWWSLTWWYASRW